MVWIEQNFYSWSIISYLFSLKIDAQFHDNLNAIATKKIDENNDEWWSLKKKYLENNSSSNFFFNTFQKTKQNLSKIVFNKESSHHSKSSIKHQKDERPLSLSSSTSSLSTTDQFSKNDENSAEIVKSYFESNITKPFIFNIQKDSEEKLETENASTNIISGNFQYFYF